MKNITLILLLALLTFGMSCTDTNQIFDPEEQTILDNDGQIKTRSTGICGIDTEDKICIEKVHDFNNLLVDMAHCTTPNVYEACFWVGSITYMVCEDPATGQVEVNVSDLELIGHSLSCALDENGDLLDHVHDYDCITAEIMEVIIPILILEEATERLEGLNCETSEYITSNYSSQTCVAYCEETFPNGGGIVRIVPCGTEACCVTTTQWCFVDGRIQARESMKEQFGSCVPDGLHPCKTTKGGGINFLDSSCHIRGCN